MNGGFVKPFNEHGGEKAKFGEIGDEGLHGDVIVTRSEFGEDFASMPEVLDACLAYGEMTGHRHQIFGEPGSFQLRECPKTKVRHLRVVSPVALKHQEHDKVILPPGDYRIGIQKEYDPFEKLTRRVAD
jgi:hypothetical protein